MSSSGTKIPPLNFSPQAAFVVKTGIPEAIASDLANEKLSPFDKKQKIDAML